jgi:hypothetical protein
MAAIVTSSDRSADPVRVDAPTLQDRRKRLDALLDQAADEGAYTVRLSVGDLVGLLGEGDAAAERLDTLEAQLAAAANTLAAHVVEGHKLQEERDFARERTADLGAALAEVREEYGVLEAQLADAQSDERLYRRSFDNLHEAYELLREESDALRGQVTQAVNIVREERDTSEETHRSTNDAQKWAFSRVETEVLKRVLAAFAAAGLPVGGETPPGKLRGRPQGATSTAEPTSADPTCGSAYTHAVGGETETTDGEEET